MWGGEHHREGGGRRGETKEATWIGEIQCLSSSTLKVSVIPAESRPPPLLAADGDDPVLRVPPRRKARDACPHKASARTTKPNARF